MKAVEPGACACRRLAPRWSKSAATAPAIDRSVKAGEHPAMVADLLQTLSVRARQAGLNDRQWAAKAGLRPETLSRVRRRGHCDSATLDALAQACGAALAVQPAPSPDGLFPASFGRDEEEALLQLALSGNRDPVFWRQLGPTFFMAGFAVFLSVTSEANREAYSVLAEELHPGITSQDAFRRWLRGAPVKAARFLPVLAHMKRPRSAAQANHA
jgi:hypothetical protein